MLIEINLLPNKGKKRGTGSLLNVGILVIILLIGGSIFTYSYLSTNKSLASATLDLTQVQTKMQEQQQKIKHMESSSSGNQLKQLIDWAKTNQVSTVQVLDTLSGRLPQDGYFVNYQFNSGTINISIQFTSMNEVANYLYQLQTCNIVQSVELSNVTTKDIDKAGSANAVNVDNSEEILPRYLAQFQIKLNLEKVKKPQEDTVK